MKKNKNILVVSVLIVLVVFIFLLLSNRSEYKKQVELFKKVKAQDIEQLIERDEKFLLYIGRETCPACRDFVPILHDYSNNKDIIVYYFRALTNPLINRACRRFFYLYSNIYYFFK